MVSLWGRNVCAQDSISVDFSVVIPETCTLPAAQRLELKEKLESAVARSNASGDAETTPFVIVPDLIVTDVKTAESTVLPLTLIQGELVLLVKNRYDGSVYNELTVPLKETRQGGGDKDAAQALIRSINPKDARFVRFIRVSRKRIIEKYKDTELVIP